MNDRHKGSMHPVESSLHRLHWVLLRKTEGRVGDLVSLGAVGLEAERKRSWAETSGGLLPLEEGQNHRESLPLRLRDSGLS